uniref:Uncharacterized protein n=1 Tax=Rhizophora mucronata TaxID=61149 RepID=A0A2P2NEJ0_RHIMU
MKMSTSFPDRSKAEECIIN